MKSSGFDQRYLLQYPKIQRRIYAEKVWDIVSHVKNIAGALILTVGITSPTPAGASCSTYLQRIPDKNLHRFSHLKDEKTQKIQTCGEGDIFFGLIPDPNFFNPQVCNPLLERSKIQISDDITQEF